MQSKIQRGHKYLIKKICQALNSTFSSSPVCLRLLSFTGGGQLHHVLIKV